MARLRDRGHPRAKRIPGAYSLPRYLTGGFIGDPASDFRVGGKAVLGAKAQGALLVRGGGFGGPGRGLGPSLGPVPPHRCPRGRGGSPRVRGATLGAVLGTGFRRGSPVGGFGAPRRPGRPALGNCGTGLLGPRRGRAFRGGEPGGGPGAGSRPRGARASRLWGDPGRPERNLRHAPQGSSGMRATQLLPLVLALALVVAAPASAAQVIAPRDVAAPLAVRPDGRAFVVSPTARPDSGAVGPSPPRRAPGRAFGPSRALMRLSRRRASRWMRPWPPTAAA